VAPLAAARSGPLGPPGRGGRDRRLAGRSARDDAADRSLRGEGMIAGASQLRLALRSWGEGTRGPHGAVGTEAVFAERRKLDDEVERRPDSLSELREHAFVKVRWRSDGSLDFLQVPLQAARVTGAGAVDAALDRLAGRWRRYWPTVDAAGLVADVRKRLDLAAAAWDLSDVRPLDGGVVALVCAATQARRPVILKVNPRGHPDDRQLAREGHALRFWQPTGAAAELLGERDHGFTLLMERLIPGDPLEDASLSREEKLVELGRLAARLHAAGPAPPAFEHLRDFVPEWRAAVPELGDLLIPRDDDVLIHCDLHAGNALQTQTGWKVIDPKGLRADRHADVWALLDPSGLELLPEEPEAAAATAERWLTIYSKAAALDPNRAREWARQRARAEARECEARPDPEAAEWVAALHRMADALGHADARG
jgi:streptomycin 6-kinase